MVALVVSYKETSRPKTVMPKGGSQVPSGNFGDRCVGSVWLPTKARIAGQRYSGPWYGHRFMITSLNKLDLVESSIFLDTDVREDSNISKLPLNKPMTIVSDSKLGPVGEWENSPIMIT